MKWSQSLNTTWKMLKMKKWINSFSNSNRSTKIYLNSVKLWVKFRILLNKEKINHLILHFTDLGRIRYNSKKLFQNSGLFIMILSSESLLYSHHSKRKMSENKRIASFKKSKRIKKLMDLLNTLKMISFIQIQRSSSFQNTSLRT